MEEEQVENKFANQPRWLTILRILLGLVLFWKGIFFLQNYVYFEQITQNTKLSVFKNHEPQVAFLITYISLLAGLFITVGLFTRVMCIIQIPILLCAVFFVNLNAGTGVQDSEFVLSVIVLTLLFIFALFGSGILSADEYFRSYIKAATEKGQTNKIFENAPEEEE